MPRVLVLGATGYVGSTLASSLLRSGLHTVYGLARTPEKARQLAIAEVIPVLGSIADSAAYIELIKTVHIDVVVDVAGANMESAKILEDVMRAGKERLVEGGAKLGFIYTSGTFVHGSSHDLVNDLDPVGTEHAKTQPPRLVAWRPKMEQDVLAARDVLNTMVIRPALIYGRESPIWTSFLTPLLEAAKSGESKVQIPIRKDSRSSLAHVDDVAAGLACAVNKVPLISGTGVHPIFDLASSCEPMTAIFQAAADVMGFKGCIELVGAGENVFAEAMGTSGNCDSGRAQEILGWQPKRRGFVSGMSVYANAFMAAQEM
ncbi:hypothetical protein MMC12_005391 [Toensbergia leucococca]|nr:hypothetical protein [Toensbergia leucococca]